MKRPAYAIERGTDTRPLRDLPTPIGRPHRLQKAAGFRAMKRPDGKRPLAVAGALTSALEIARGEISTSRDYGQVQPLFLAGNGLDVEMTGQSLGPGLLPKRSNSVESRPMTRFTMTNDVSWGSGGSPRSVAIITENQEGFEAYAAKASAALKDSEDLLRNTITALSKKSFDGDIMGYANCYFLTGKSLSSDVANNISAVLQLSLAGLLGMMGTSALKIKQTDTTAGRVSNRGFSDGSPQESTKPYHNARSRMGNTRVWRAGAIHISGDRLDEGKLGVKTLIHEATHKYAGTVDYCYFDEETPLNKPNKFEHHVKAMQNADSFAWFTLMVGRGNFFSRHFGFNNKM